MSKLEQRLVGQCKPDPTQPRKHFDEADLRALGESLRVRQNDPIQVMPDGTIIDGERRWRAANLVGLEKLDVIVTDKPLSPKELAIIRLSTFLHRADLSGYEKWMACAELMCMNPDWDQKTLAEHLKRDDSSVTRLLSPSKNSEAWQAALRDNLVTISDCYEASKKPLDVQDSLLALKLSGAVSNRTELARAGRRDRSAPAVRANKIKISLTSGSTVTVSGADLSLDDAIEAAKDAVKEMTKGRDLGLDSKTIQAVCRDKAKAG